MFKIHTIKKHIVVIIIIGYFGSVGVATVSDILIPHLGMDLLGMVRNSKQVPNIEKLGARAVVADLEDEFAHAFDDVNNVVFTAGSGGHTGADKTLMVDLYGAVRAIEEESGRVHGDLGARVIPGEIIW